MRLAQFPVELEGIRAGSAQAVLDALDCLRVAVTIFDSQEKLIHANAHYNYLFRSLPPHEDLVGRCYGELIALELAGGELAFDGDANAYIEQRRTQFQSGDYAPRDIHLSDGRIVEIKARRTAEGGWIALWTDATQARHVLARLEDAIHLSADAFAFWDRHDRLILCNDAFAQLHGYGKTDDLIGISFTDMIKNTARRGFVKIEGDAEGWIARRIDTHRSPAGALTLTMASGAAYFVRERAMRDGGRATVYTDVTDRSRAETALAEQTRALERTERKLANSETEAKKQATYLSDLTRRLDEASVEADTAKTTLLRTMSHELKTPLNAILGFADLMRATASRIRPDQIAEYSGLIHMAGGNLLRLINQILDLTKIAAGRFPLNCSAIPAGTMLRDASELYGPRASEKQVLLEAVECDGASVHADEMALATMVRNLVENAVTFTQKGGTIWLSAKRHHTRVHITIADNGPGVAAPDLSRITEPFEQASRGMTDKPNGAGLGLPLVKALAELHGGTLTLHSVQGEGFTAILDLPAADIRNNLN